MQQQYGNLDRFMNDIFSTARDIGSMFEERAKKERQDRAEPYGEYSYPHANVFVRDDRSMVFEFGLPGVREEEITLEFQSDWLLLSTKPQQREEEGRQYLLRQLRVNPVIRQRYSVPEDRFDHRRVKASFKDGILTVVAPSKEASEATGNVTVEINVGEEQ